MSDERLVDIGFHCGLDSVADVHFAQAGNTHLSFEVLFHRVTVAGEEQLCKERRNGKQG